MRGLPLSALLPQRFPQQVPLIFQVPAQRDFSWSPATLYANTLVFSSYDLMCSCLVSVHLALRVPAP